MLTPTTAMVAAIRDIAVLEHSDSPCVSPLGHVDVQNAANNHIFRRITRFGQ